MGQDQDAALAELRREIDRLDREMHERLIERGRIIDRLIQVKGGTAATGSAFRPEREASMMRTMAQRHEGGLPFAAVEGIWRIIISTFTHQQAPFAVHADLSGDATAMRDSARYHFGFTVPLIDEAGPKAVIDAVSSSHGDLGLVAIESGQGGRAWWHQLEAPEAPKIIAHLPFVERTDHPAPYPVLVVAKSISGEGLGATALYAAAGLAGDGSALASLGGRIVSERGQDVLIALPREIDAGSAKTALGAVSLTMVGSHPSSQMA